MFTVKAQVALFALDQCRILMSPGAPCVSFLPPLGLWIGNNVANCVRFVQEDRCVLDDSDSFACISDTATVLLVQPIRLCLERTGDELRPDLLSGFSVGERALLKLV